MDPLRTAVVDITTLVAARHALAPASLEGEHAVRRTLLKRLRRDLRRGTLAYIDALARSKGGSVDDTLLDACRVAAERQMVKAIQHQALLARVMLNEPGSLSGLAAARQDLWRLAHMAIHLRNGIAALRCSGVSADVESSAALAGRLRRRLRKALIAYARAALRTNEPDTPPIVAARRAALAQLGRRGAAEAERLSEIEFLVDPMYKTLRQGVVKPLVDLALDWCSGESVAAPGSHVGRSPT